MDLSLLLPEISIVVVMTLIVLLEIFLPEWTHRFSLRLNLAGILGVACVLLAALHRRGTVFDGMYSSDSFAFFFKFLFLATAGCVFLMKQESSLKVREAEFHLLFWGALLGMFFLVSSKHFLLFFISLELLTLSLYILTAYTQGSLASIEAGLKYLILGSLASAFLLYGVSLIYASSGTLSFDELQNVLKEGGSSWILITGFLLVISALGFKVAAVPFHVWVPDVYQGAPTPVVAFLSVASKSAGFAAFLRILFGILGSWSHERRILFGLLGSMTLLYGNLGALVQKDIKRLLGYSSIAHAGFLLMALASEKDGAASSLIYYLMAYAVSNLTIFLAVSMVGDSKLENYAGLSRRSPLLAGGMFLALLSLAGVPPLAGFFGKFFVLLSLAKNRLFGIVFLGAINVAISLYYYLSVVRILYFEKPKEETVLSLNPPSTALLLALVTGILLIGVWQAPFFQIAFRVSASIF